MGFEQRQPLYKAFYDKQKSWLFLLSPDTLQHSAALFFSAHIHAVNYHLICQYNLSIPNNLLSTLASAPTTFQIIKQSFARSSCLLSR
jgi:hypothetical protein